MKPETAAIHVPGTRRDGAVAPPLHLSTTFEHGPANELIHGYQYVRSGNPNVDELEARLAALEGGARAVAFASGMAAGAGLLATLVPGSEVVFHDNLYKDFRDLALRTLPRWGLRAHFVDVREEDRLAAVLSPATALIWIETPSNPQIDIIDIARLADAARSVRAKLLVDGTFATPALQRPFLHGADYVLHSLTKYMGGHSDVQGGAVILREDSATAEAVVHHRTLTGGVLAPFNAWMISRGLQTLHCRLAAHSANAAQIAAHLAEHPKVARVRYPFLQNHPGADIARRQMTAGGGMVSFDMTGGRTAAIELAARVGLFINATSLGGVESLIEHRASVEGAQPVSPENLLRLSVGLEHIDDLIADLDQALEGI